MWLIFLAVAAAIPLTIFVGMTAFISAGAKARAGARSENQLLLMEIGMYAAILLLICLAVGGFVMWQHGVV